MLKLSAVFLLATCLTTTAEARTKYQLKPQPSEAQRVQWKNGVQYVDDAKPKTVVRIANMHDMLPDDQSTFRVYVLNSSDTPITFGPDNVTIEQSADRDKIVAMLSSDELEGRARRDMKRRNALAAIGNAFSMQAANGYTTGSVSYSGMVNGQIYHGTGSYSEYNPALAYQQQRVVQAQASINAQMLQERQSGQRLSLNQLMKTTTVEPGQTFGGTVAFDAPSSFKRIEDKTPITVVIRIGEEEHRILALVSRIP